MEVRIILIEQNIKIQLARSYSFLKLKWYSFIESRQNMQLIETEKKTGGVNVMSNGQSSLKLYQKCKETFPKTIYEIQAE